MLKKNNKHWKRFGWGIFDAHSSDLTKNKYNSETNSVFKVEKIGEFDNQEDSILDYLNSDEEAYEKAKEAGFIIDKDGVIVGLGDIKMVDIDPNELY